MPYPNIAINRTPIFVWYVVCGVDLRTDTKKTCVKKRIGQHAQNTLTILGSIVIIMVGEGSYMII